MNSAVALEVLLPITVLLIIVVICLTWRLRNARKPQASEFQRENKTEKPWAYMELQPKEACQRLGHTTGRPLTGGAQLDEAYENPAIDQIPDTSMS